jgi:hypothetical protein
VAQAILMDEELFEGGRRTGMGSGDRNTFGKLREPVTRIIHWARAFKVKSKTGYWVVKNMRAGSDTIDQQPMFAPGVFNFFRPGYTPSGLRTAALNLVAPEFQIASEVTVTNYINFLNQIVEYGIDHGGWSSYLWPADEVKPDYTAWIEKARNPSSLVAELSLLMSASQLHPDTLDIIADAVSKSAGRTRDELKARVMIAIVLVMASPEYLIQQ